MCGRRPGRRRVGRALTLLGVLLALAGCAERVHTWDSAKVAAAARVLCESRGIEAELRNRDRELWVPSDHVEAARSLVRASGLDAIPRARRASWLDSLGERRAWEDAERIRLALESVPGVVAVGTVVESAGGRAGLGVTVHTFAEQFADEGRVRAAALAAAPTLDPAMLRVGVVQHNAGWAPSEEQAWGQGAAVHACGERSRWGVLLLGAVGVISSGAWAVHFARRWRGVAGTA